jgi:hypothetical protein
MSAAFRRFAVGPLSLICSASFGTVPEPSRAQRGGWSDSPASEESLQPRTLDGEDPFHKIVIRGKGASNSLLPQADSSLRPPSSPVSRDRFCRIRPLFQSLGSLPSRSVPCLCRQASIRTLAGLSRSPVQVGIRLCPGAVLLGIDLTRRRVVSRDRAVARISAKTRGQGLQ